MPTDGAERCLPELPCTCLCVDEARINQMIMRRVSLCWACPALMITVRILSRLGDFMAIDGTFVTILNHSVRVDGQILEHLFTTALVVLSTIVQKQSRLWPLKSVNINLCSHESALCRTLIIEEEI